MTPEQTVAGGAGPKPTIVITAEEVAVKPKPALPAAPPAPAAGPPASEAAPRPAEEPELAPAGFWLRLAAKLVDQLVVLLIVAVLAGAELLARGLYSPEVWENVRAAWLRLLVNRVLPAQVLLYSFYTVFVHAGWGRSIGKAICGIRVLPPADRGWRVSYFFARFLAACFTLPLLGLGHLMAGFRADKRALHDLVVGSRVVKQSGPE